MNNTNFEIKPDEIKYLSIYNHFKKLIEDGVLTKSEKLPSKRLLSLNLNVSLNSVIKAYEILEDEGYIYSKEKKGYYVNDIEFHNYKVERLVEKEKTSASYRFDFSTFSNNISTFPKDKYLRIIKDILNDDEFYTKSEQFGNLKLKNTLVKYLKEEKNIQVSSEQIIISSSSYLLINKLIEFFNFDNIILENPSFYNNKKFNAKKTHINLDQDGIDINALFNQRNSLMVLTPYSSYPLGISMSLKRKREIIDYTTKNNIYIVEDSFDYSFKYSSYPSTSLFNMSNNVIYMESFTKTMYPGLSISYMVLPVSLVNDFKKKSFCFESISTLSSLSLEKFISLGYLDNYVNKRRKDLKKKKEYILSHINKKYINVIYDKGYSCIIVEFKGPFDKLKKEFKNRKININPLSEFLINDSNLFVLGFESIDLNQIDDALNEINDIIDSLI